MAFCPNCGTQATGRFCPNCGFDLGITAGAGASASYVPPAEPLRAPGLSTNVAGALCYLFWVITGIIFLVISPYNRNRIVRFHAFQAIFATIAFIIIQIVLAIFTGFLGAVHMWALATAIWIVYRVAVFLLWLYMMYTAYNNRKVVLPVIGPLAEKQA